MPYKRSYKRRASIKRSRRVRRRPNVRQINFFTPRNMYAAARYAARGVNMLKGIVNSELHRFSLTNSVNVDTTGAIVHLSAIAQGDDVNNRQGNSILYKYLTFHNQLQMNPSATGTIVRVMVFVDTESTAGTAPTIAQLQETASSTISPINADYTSRFTVLFDDIIDLSINGQRVDNRKHYSSLNFHAKYTGSAAANYDKNQIFLFYVSNEAVNTPILNYYSRIAYYDN